MSLQEALVGTMWMVGLYVASLAAALGSTGGAPKILQVVAETRVIEEISWLQQGVRS